MNINEIVIIEEAVLDLKQAENFYELQGKGLGKYYKDSIISDIESLWLYAGIHKKVYGVYRLLSKKFPYAIYYIIKGDMVIIVAILDLRQNPNRINSILSERNSNLGDNNV